MQDFKHQKVLLGICGGIAAYKAAFLVRELVQAGACVKVVMTSSAQQFITPLTLQGLSGNEVRCELFDSQAERAMSHIELARWADCLLIAPASANTIAKLAHGIADDLLSTLYLVANVPVLVCPAMNHSMWEHSATQANCALLRSRSVIIVGPEEGEQACGEFGYGRMSDVSSIMTALRLYDVKQLLTNRSVLVTAGPTHEPIDPVRYLSNRSSGKMGYALAAAAQMAGAKVTLVSGPTQLMPPAGVSVCSVRTAHEMFDAVMEHMSSDTLFISAAAVADYRVASSASHKIKKSEHEVLHLALEANSDILATVALNKKAAFVVGFAAETHRVLDYAKKKLNEKKLDMIIANQVGDQLGFDVDDNQVIILTQDEELLLPKNHKMRIASQIISTVARCASLKLQKKD